MISHSLPPLTLDSIAAAKAKSPKYRKTTRKPKTIDKETQVDAMRRLLVDAGAQVVTVKAGHIREWPIRAGKMRDGIFTANGMRSDFRLLYRHPNMNMVGVFRIETAAGECYTREEDLTWDRGERY